jgi:hypothetical protein
MTFNVTLRELNCQYCDKYRQQTVICDANCHFLHFKNKKTSVFYKLAIIDMLLKAANKHFIDCKIPFVLSQTVVLIYE